MFERNLCFIEIIHKRKKKEGKRKEIVDEWEYEGKGN